ncbi:ABC transporter permease [bacterium]|nr:ABC transporter permease [bacterium]MCB1220917.1 ABC transporter permease [bacterium]UNM07632.1 MAG: ABC transporter permease [Planctomycetales bacterium]
MRTIWLSLVIGYRMLMRNKLRSLLTLLGIILGVGAVIAIVSLGEGLRHQFTANITSMGGDVFFMTPVAPKRPGQARQPMKMFTMDDMRAVEEQTTLVRDVIPAIDVGVTAKHGNNTTNGHVLGVAADYMDDIPEKIEQGRFFTQAEVNGASRVVVIGHDIMDDLFEDYENAVGSQVRLNGTNYEIIGLIEKRKNIFDGAPNPDTGFLSPVSTVQKRIIGNDDVFWVSLYLADGADVKEAKEEVATIMRQRRRIRNASDDDFQFISPDQFLEIGNQFLNVLISIFGGVAFISLLVGGVGIMNIMLVSVTERTKEIGLRLALGAPRPAVLTQFIIESIMLTLTGGMFGVLSGYGLAKLAAIMLEKTIDGTWIAVIPMQWLVYSVLVSIFIGLVFGVYPAWKASKLDPVEAMRFD